MSIGMAGGYNKECKARSSDNISLSLQVVKIEHPCDSALISPRPTDIYGFKMQSMQIPVAHFNMT